MIQSLKVWVGSLVKFSVSYSMPYEDTSEVAGPIFCDSYLQIVIGSDHLMY